MTSTEPETYQSVPRIENEPPKLDHRQASSLELIEAIGTVDLEVLRRHHVTLAIAVAELSRSAGKRWPWGPDDPTVALLRAAAKLAIDAPQAASEHAERLRVAIEA